MIDRRDRFRDHIWCAILASALVCGLAAALSGFRLTPGSVPRLCAASITIAILPFIRPERFGRLRPVVEAVETLLLFATLGMIGAVASYVAMVHSGPMTDTLLDRADRMLGFDWPAIRASIDARPMVLATLHQAYDMCFVMPLAVVAILAATNRSRRLYDFLAAYGLALLATIAVAFFFPAEAAFEHYRYAATPANGAHFAGIIHGLRSGGLRDIDLGNLGGIITFPSFHASMAILFIWAAWPYRTARIPMVALNSLMWAAAVPIGGHYIVDLIGGSVVAIAAVGAVRHFRNSTAQTVGNRHPPTCPPYGAPAAWSPLDDAGVQR